MTARASAARRRAADLTSASNARRQVKEKRPTPEGPARVTGGPGVWRRSPWRHEGASGEGEGSGRSAATRGGFGTWPDGAGEEERDEANLFHRRSTPNTARARAGAKLHAVTTWHGKEGTCLAAKSCLGCSPSIREVVGVYRSSKGAKVRCEGSLEPCCINLGRALVIHRELIGVLGVV